MSIIVDSLLQGDWYYRKKLGQTKRDEVGEEDCGGIGVGFKIVVRISTMENLVSESRLQGGQKLRYMDIWEKSIPCS